MKRYGLEPLEFCNCYHCQHIYYDVDKGYYCDLHRDVDMAGTLPYEVNDCTDFAPERTFSVSTTPTYDRRVGRQLKKVETKKESGQLSLF